MLVNDYANKLRTYLDLNSIQYTDGDTLLEELYLCYTEANPLDNPELRKQFQLLYCSLPELSEDKFDEVFSIVNDLSVQQEKLAFQIGIKIGFRLASELLE